MSVALNLPTLSPSPKICVAVSGGADSMALAVLTKEWIEKNGGSMHAVHVDHRLRVESKTEAAITKTRLAALGIECDVLVWLHNDIKTAIQEKARDARYDLMTKWCKQRKFPYLFTAHHVDDQAETIAFRLWRGAGIEGLAGMRQMRTLSGINLIRPLLDEKKEALKDYLKEKNIEWIEDPSNEDLKYDRIKIRHMLAQDPQLGPKLISLSQHMKLATDALGAKVASFLDEHANMTDTQAVVDVDAFKQLPFDYRFRVLSTLIAKYSTRAETPRGWQLERIAKELPTKATLAGVEIRANDKLLAVG